MAIDFTKNYPVIEWDLNRSFFRIEKYFGKKEENSRGFKIQILQDSEILIPTTETLRIYCKKPDNTKVYIDASAIEDTYFVINLTNQVFALPGIVECELQLNSNSKWRYSPTFGIDVSDNLVDGSIISSDDFIALQNALASIDNKIDWSKVVNNTVTASSGFILDGRVGKTLQDQITTLNDKIAHQNVAYVETNGDDATGMINQIAKPFATINKALDSLPATGGVIKIGLGTFPPIDPSKVKDNVQFLGSGQPRVNSTYTALEGGTIVQAMFGIFNHDNITVKDMGIDGGLNVCNALYGGVGVGGFIFVIDGTHVFKTPKKGLVIENLTTLCKDSSTMEHSCLIEGVEGAYVKNVRAYYGVHGIVFKAFNSNANGLYAYGNDYDGLIIKSSSYARSGSLNISDVYIGTIDGKGGGLMLDDEDPTYPLSSVNINNVVIVSTTYGILLQSAYSIDNISLTNVLIASVSGKAILCTGQVQWSNFSNINIMSCVGNGIELSAETHNNNFSNINIVSNPSTSNGIGIVSKGFENNFSNCYVTNNNLGGINCILGSFGKNDFNGCKVSGNLAGDIIGETNMISWNNADYKSNPLPINAPWANFGSGNPEASFYKENNVVHLSGLITGGAVGSFPFSLPVDYRPSKPIRVLCTTEGGTARIIIGSDGVGSVEAVNGTIGGYLSLDGVSFRLS